MVGQWTLNPFILVRIQVPEQCLQRYRQDNGLGMSFDMPFSFSRRRMAGFHFFTIRKSISIAVVEPQNRSIAELFGFG